MDNIDKNLDSALVVGYNNARLTYYQLIPASLLKEVDIHIVGVELQPLITS